jgi:hypothetical protein
MHLMVANECAFDVEFAFNSLQHFLKWWEAVAAHEEDM